MSKSYLKAGCIFFFAILSSVLASADFPLTEAIPFNQLGSEAEKQYSGDGISIRATDEGARLRVDFQKLEASVTSEGLWLESTEDTRGTERIRLLAGEFGRVGGGEGTVLAREGKVVAGDSAVVFARPGLVEEYRVGMDGVRQDFVVLERPGGDGELQVLVEVAGAVAETAGEGIRLTLSGSGRKIAYSRLHVTDASGRELEARMEAVDGTRVRILVDDTDAVYPVRVDPTFSDADWVSMGGLAGTDNIVRAVVADESGNLFIAGGFTAVGETLANRIAKWDGSEWSALGSGMDSTVNALMVFDGNLYAGGSFTTAGGNTAHCIAKWDGNEWSALGAGMDSDVTSFAVYDGGLYAGGYFTTAGDNPASRIAKWDGSDWTALGAGLSAPVNALSVFDGGLYVGGLFTTAGGNPANYVAEWDGSEWSAVGMGTNGTVYALAVLGTDLCVGGSFTTAGGNPANYVAKWDGSNWSTLGSGLGDTVFALAADNSELYASGNFTTAGGNPASYIAKWDGSDWSALGSGLGFAAYALAMLDGDIYAGGFFTSAGSTPAARIAKWDGTNWGPLQIAMGLNGVVYALAEHDGNLYAGGSFTAAGGNLANYVAKWDGSAWSALGSGTSGTVYALAALGNDLYVGGSFTTAGGNPANYVAKWDGSDWSALGSGTLGGFVFSLVPLGTDLYAGGSFYTAGGSPASNIAKWDGSVWSALGSGMDSSVVALAALNDELYAGGYFTTAGGNPVDYIAKWDGSNWSGLGSGMNSDVSSLAILSGELYAGGSFSTAGGSPASRVAKWDGSGWSALGAGVSSSVETLAVLGGDLYVGGQFIAAGGTPANRVAKWDGNEWSALGSGVNSTVKALSALNGDIYAGGFFISAGDKLSAYIARAVFSVFTVAGNSVEVANGDNTPSLADFTDFGTTSSTTFRTFTISNGGNADLTLTDSPAAVALSGSSAFIVTQQPASPLAPDADTTFIVTFAPDTPGAHNATVSIASNDADRNPYTFALAGIATLPQITVSGNGTPISDGSATPDLNDHTAFGSVSVLGGSLARTFTLANEGDEDLLLDDAPASIAVSGSSAFSVTQQATSPVAPDSETTFAVTFSPTTSGPHSATVSIANNDPGKDPYTFALSGTGIQPTLSVLGNGSAVPSGSGDPGDGDHRQFGPVRFPSGNNTRTFTLANTGSATLNFTGGPDFVSISGSSAFTVTAQPGSSIAPDNEATFTISFTPNAPGLHTATVTIASDDPEAGIYTFTIQGFGTQPLISVIHGAKTLTSDKGTLKFTTVEVRKRGKPMSVSIRNDGSDDIVGLKISTKGPQRREFRIVGPANKLLLPGQSTLFKATFRPTATGNRKATLEIRSNAANGQSFRIKVKGRGN